MRYWRILFFAGLLVAALAGLARGHVGSGLFWGLLAGLALAGELVEARQGAGRGPMTVAALFGVTVSLALVAVAVGMIAAAVVATSAEERNPYIAGTVLVVPVAVLACSATIAGYRRVRRVQRDSEPRRPASAVYAELVAEARAHEEAQPDPQRRTRQHRMRLFLGVAAAGWVCGRLVEVAGEDSNSTVALLLASVSVLLLVGGLLAAGWTSVWVFRDRAGNQRPDRAE